jgi:cysteinyl-tRNA synthetase
MNITDVETKGIVAAKKQKIDFWKLMQRNTQRFFSELKDFRAMPASIYPKASGSIQEMALAVKRMLDSGHAYKHNGDIYFDVSKAKEYGVLSGHKFKKGDLGRRVRLYDYIQSKAGDFLLWYKYSKSDGKIFWNTALGKGKPAWNAECPALCMKYLKIPMDIHAGGQDNIFSHHENEIAQIRSLTGKMPAKYWFHVRHLMVNKHKMSKTLKNYHSIPELKKMGISMMAIKWLLLSEPYTRRLNFTMEKLRKYERYYDEFQKTMGGIKNTKKCKRREHFCPIVEEKRKQFFLALDDSLDFPKALEIALSLVCEADRRKKQGRLCKGCMKSFVKTIREFDKATGAFPV